MYKQSVNIRDEFHFSEVHGSVNIRDEFHFSEVHGSMNATGQMQC